MENTENKINTTDLTVMNESESQSLTESAVMNEVRVHSTPVSTKISNESDNEMFRYFCNMMYKMSSKFDEQKTKSESNFNELNKKFEALNNRLDNSDEKCDNKFDEISKRFDPNDAKFDHYKERNMKFENSINVKCDELIKWCDEKKRSGRCC